MPVEVIVTPSYGVQVKRVAINHAQFGTLPLWRGDRLPSQYSNTVQECHGILEPVLSR
jgi:hypothetical protein